MILFAGRWTNWRTALVNKVRRFRMKKVTCFLSSVEDRSKHKYKYTHLCMWLTFAIVGLFHGTRRRRERERH
jgi:hypothetical protein